MSPNRAWTLHTSALANRRETFAKQKDRTKEGCAALLVREEERIKGGK